MASKENQTVGENYQIRQAGKVWLLKAHRKTHHLSFLKNAVNVYLEENVIIADDEIFEIKEDTEGNLTFQKVEDLPEYKPFEVRSQESKGKSDLASELKQNTIQSKDESSVPEAHESVSGEVPGCRKAKRANEISEKLPLDENLVHAHEDFNSLERGTTEAGSIEKIQNINYKLYIEVENVPVDSTEVELETNLFGPIIPVARPKLIYCKGSSTALLICQSESDSGTLRSIKHNTFTFRQMDDEILGPYTLKLDKSHLRKFKELNSLENFVVEMKKAYIHVNMDDTPVLTVPTFYQLRYVSFAIEHFCSPRHCVERTHTISEKGGTITFKMPSYIWKYIQHFGEYRCLASKCTNISYLNETLVIRLPAHDSLKREVRRMAEVSSISRWNEWIEIPDHDKSPELAEQWCSEIEKTCGFTCCRYVGEMKIFVVFGKHYDTVLKIRHELSIKLGLIKATGRRRNTYRENN